MNFFIGIVPPAEIYQAIQNIQQPFGDNRLEPHITLRPPVALVDKNAWLEQIRNVASAFQTFTIHLPGTGNFGTGVLFVDVQSTKLYELYSKLILALRPFERTTKKDEERTYHPHLTLGRRWCGFTSEGFKEMRKLANEYLSKAPVSFSVESLRIYHKSGSKRYELLQNISLGVQH